MTRFETPRVSVVGAGEIGRGWAALCIAAGWPITIYDADADALTRAADAIADRVVALLRLKRADPNVAEAALNQMQVGRSLLQAVAEADWIIEAVPDELQVKAKALQLTEQVARRAAIITSSASAHGPTALSSRLERPDRFLVAHPQTPVEFIPLVEVVPSPMTDPACVEDIRFWLSMLGRAPIVLKKEVPGNLAGRLSAAVWRECIQLVVDGVLDVEDVDRAVSIGPGLEWVATGPHLDHHLDSGRWGVELYLSRLFAEHEPIWQSLADWKHLPPEEQKRVIKLIDRAYTPHTDELREARLQRLVRMLGAIRE